MGKKSDNGNSLERVGRLKLNVAKAIHRKCAYIYITQRSIAHIEKRHEKEFNQLGITAIDFVKLVLNEYNQIRIGSDDSLLLVVFNGETNNTAGIKMNLEGNKWIVATAEPRSTQDIMKRKLLWEK